MKVIDNSDPKRGLFACATPDDASVKELKARFADCPIKTNELNDMPHCTVCYSKETGVEPPKELDYVLRAKGFRLEFWPGHDDAGYMVLKLESAGLRQVAKVFVDLGAEAATFKDYNPHMTIAKDFGKPSTALSKWMGTMNARLADDPVKINFTHVECNPLKD